MGEYCAAAAAEGEQPVAVAVLPLPPAVAARYLYGDYDRCSTKQVFDNLHGNISLDPVSQRFDCFPFAPLSSPPSSLPFASLSFLPLALVSLRRLGSAGWLAGLSCDWLGWVWGSARWFGRVIRRFRVAWRLIRFGHSSHRSLFRIAAPPISARARSEKNTIEGYAFPCAVCACLFVRYCCVSSSRALRF